MKCATIITAAVAAALACPAAASGTFWDLRYRHERVDDDVRPARVSGDTLRMRLGYLWEMSPRWSTSVEGVHVEALGTSAFPVVPDPARSELGEAWLRWRGGGAEVTAGRQRIAFDDQRFVGASAWRQHEQSFDALRVGAGPLTYAYVDGVQRPNGTRRDHRTHLLHARVGHGVVVHGVLIDDRDVPVDSSATFGVRWNAERGAFGWTVAAARQRDHADNPLDHRATYHAVSGTWTPRRVAWSAGWERLGGDGVRGFSTPLATLHGFNGWADRFTTTPPGGLDDRHAGAAGRLGRGRWQVRYHDFDGLGTEWNASYGAPVGRARWLVKLADHDARGAAPDVTKLWLQLEWGAR